MSDQTYCQRAEKDEKGTLHYKDNYWISPLPEDTRQDIATRAPCCTPRVSRKGALPLPGGMRGRSSREARFGKAPNADMHSEEPSGERIAAALSVGQQVGRGGYIQNVKVVAPEGAARRV